MEEKNLIGIKDMVQLGGIILMGLTVFLGLNYSYGPVYAVPTALVIIIAAYGAVYILVKLKKSETNQAQKQTIELLLLIFGYGAIVLISGLFILHFLTVETKLKSEIKRIATNSIEEFDVISNDYNTFVNRSLESLEIKIDAAYKDKKSNTNSKLWEEMNLSGDVKDLNLTKLIETEQNSLKVKIEEPFEDIHDDAIQFQKQTKAAVDKWDYFSIVEKLKIIDEKKNEFIIRLTTLSNKQTHDKDIIFSPDARTTVQEKVEQLENWYVFSTNTAWGISIIAILIINGLILFPYLFSKRSGRRGPSGRDGSKDAGFTWSSK